MCYKFLCFHAQTYTTDMWRTTHMGIQFQIGQITEFHIICKHANI